MDRLDSPKCINCIEGGKKGHMYRMAGRPLFKCHDCGDIVNKDNFHITEFKWRVDPKSWKDFFTLKLGQRQKDRNIKKQVDEIEDKVKNVR